MRTLKIEETAPEHVSVLQLVAKETDLFPPELLPDMMAQSLEEGAIWHTALHDGMPTGLCFAEAELFTEGVFNMRALGVRPAAQRHGLGAALVAATESALRSAGARLLIVETSSGPSFRPARRFYEGSGYLREAQIADFWAPGEAKVIFSKALQ